MNQRRNDPCHLDAVRDALTGMPLAQTAATALARATCTSMLRVRRRDHSMHRASKEKLPMFKTPFIRCCLVLGLAIGAAPATQAQAPAQAQPPVAVYSGPVAVVVSIAVPAGLPRARVEALFQQQAPGFQALPGLKQKYFTVSDDGRRAGGIYLWANAATARAFFSDAWKTQVVGAFGSAAELIWFDAPLIIQGQAGMP